MGEQLVSTATRLGSRFLIAEDGPTTAEYAVMLALIIAGLIAVISGIGDKVSTIFTNTSAGLPTGSGS